MKRSTVIALSGLVVGCGNDSPVSPESPIDVPAPDPVPQATAASLLSERAIEIDPTDLSLLSDSGEMSAGIYRYRTEHADARLPVVDDYLLGETDDGEFYLRRVTDVTVDGDIVSTETVEAFWPEVVNGGRYSLSIPLDGSDPDVSVSTISGPRASVVPVVTLNNGFDVSFDLCTPLGEILAVPRSLEDFTLCDVTSACLQASASPPPPTPFPAIGVSACGSLSRLEPSLSLHLGGTIDVVIEVDPGSIIPPVAPSVTEVSLRGAPTIDATLGIGIGLDGSLELTLVPIGVLFKKSLGKFAEVELKLGPSISLSVEGSADVDLTVDVDGGVNFVAGWRSGGLFQFSNSLSATPSFQVNSRQLTMKGMVGIGIGAEFKANEKNDKKSFAKLEGGFETGIGAGVQQVNSRPSPCTYLDSPIPGADDCEVDNWRRDRDVIWEWSAAAFFGYKFGPITGGVKVGVPLGGGKIKDLRDVFGRGDLIVDISDQHVKPRPKTFVGYPYDTCGGTGGSIGTDPCPADILLTRIIPGRFGRLFGIPRDSLDPIAEPIPLIAISQAPPLSQSVATGAGLFQQLPPPDDCVVDRNRARTDCTLPAGIAHAVWIRGVAANCTVTDARVGPKSSGFDGNDFFKLVVLAPDTQIHEALHVDCGDTALEFGNLEVHVTTAGQNPDPDGYTLSVDGALLGMLGPNDMALFGGLPAEDKTVVLADVAPNCTVQGGTSQMVTIPTNNTAVVTFAVDCVDPTALGQVDIVTNTTGQDIPPGYTVDVGGQQSSIPANGNLVVSTPVGPTDVRLIDVAPNCIVAAPNPRTVHVGTTLTATTFDVSCKNAEAAAKTSVSGMLSVVGVTSPGTDQGNSANVRHIVDEMLDVQLDGGIIATGSVTRSYNLNGGDGTMSGTFSLDASFNGQTGLITGVLTGTVEDGMASASLSGGGSGGLAGLVFKLDLSGPFDGPFSYTGTVQNPNKQGPPQK